MKTEKINGFTIFGCFIIVLMTFFVISSYDIYVNPKPIETTIWINYEPTLFTMYQSVSPDIFIAEGIMMALGIGLFVIGFKWKLIKTMYL